MKNAVLHLAALSVMLISINQAWGQEEIVDRLAVKFSDPSKPGVLEVGLQNGGIKVTGYDGDEVVINATTKLKQISKEESETKAKGLVRVPVTNTTLSVEEEDNYMEIDVESSKQTVNLDIKVPVKISLRLSCHYNGYIDVENVTGEIEAENHYGKTTLRNISGAVHASGHHGAIIVDFKSVLPGKSMSFSTYHGDIEVTLPQSVKANVKLESAKGDVYTDFEIQKAQNPRRITEENERESDGKYRVTIEYAFFGAINGGGPEMEFGTYHGSIYIRKAK